jgi:hypothetical protein
MLGFRKSMQDVVYLQHIALVTPSLDFTEGLAGAVTGFAFSQMAS